MTTYKGTPIKLTADFLTNPTNQWKGRAYNQEYSTKQNYPSDVMEKSKAFQTSKS